MSLGSWLHRNPLAEGVSPESDSVFALSNRLRDPFSDSFADLVNAMTRFDRDFGPSLRGVNNRFLANFPTYHLDVSDDTYKLKVDVPGIRAEDLKVEVEDDGKLVHISGGRKYEKDGVVSESHFERQFRLHDSVDANSMTARLENGVLHLEAPLLHEAKPAKRLISITENPQATVKAPIAGKTKSKAKPVENADVLSELR